MSRSNDRRDFLRGLSATLIAGSAQALLPQLGVVGNALAATSRSKAFGNYRALVCVYLDGGNDSWNLLVPRDNGTLGSGSLYDRYRTARGGVYDTSANPPSGNSATGLALDFNALRPITPNGFAANSFGLHPQFLDYAFPQVPGGVVNPGYPGLASLFGQQRVALFPNIGTLVRPITKATYNATAKPPQLYSHSDQTTQWHLGRTATNHPYGWGGEVASRVASGNQLTTLAPCISISGSSRFLVGDGVYPYQMSTSGATALSNYSATAGGLQSQRRAALDLMLAQTYAHPFSKEYAQLTSRSLDLTNTLSTALTNFGAVGTVYQQSSATANSSAQVTVAGTNYSNTLLDQLRMVARMIKVSRPGSGAGINHERQIYLVRLGGFDTHDTQMANTGQPLLMARLNQALSWFRQAMIDVGNDLGVPTLPNEVTLFTMSEFARTLSSNGNGSDHGWGGVQLALGGAVAGRAMYGTFPNQTLDGPDSFSRGQFLPTTPVDTYAATLARWMGVPDIDLEQVFPNLANFSPDTLGFLP
ncbi:MAG: DUF1501 domain-containing protein [Xanthomonadales bacterium]|jgi:uncharacterized protein (DUF1501 family)|nr:DUF1501 domain-containing protein [Xanthomonadales bacterium]MBP6078761.1 DUF1501 domain-containing protein [Xanthomonadales bacterium]MBP7623297.1 DUF1501 domain-containing protein [Xanthomonadales bacterium]